jgi:hypothetical protein
MTDDSGPDKPWCAACVGHNSYTFYSYYECDRCNKPIQAVDAVPIKELEQLADGFESAANDDLHNPAARTVWRVAAEELRELLQEYGDSHE